VPPEIQRTATLRAEIDRTADLLDSVRFDLGVVDQVARRKTAVQGATIARKYLQPRLRNLDAPLLVVVFGPTGAGKYTIVNSLAGTTVSEPGALRPTTRRPVIWCHRRNEIRAAAVAGDPVIVTDDHPLLDGLTIVDTPDLDSYVAEHKEIAESVLTMADAALFVTTPQRYADAVPWEVVEDLVDRSMPLVVIANRLSRRSSGAVADLTALLRSNGVPDARTDLIIQIQEHRLKSDGRLPKAAIERVRSEIEGLVERRTNVIDQTVSGALQAVAVAARSTAAAIDRQATEGEGLWDAALSAFESQAEEVALHLDRGDLVRTEVVTRWQRMLGVTDLASIISRGWARLRDVLGGGDPVEADAVARVGSEARDELVGLVTMRAQRAITAAVTAWEIEPAARGLITEELRKVGDTLVGEAEHQVDEWLAGIVDLIHDQGRGRYRLARLASVGINGAATLLLLGIFASTAGITGTEVGVAAGAAAAQQTVLEHLFGSAAATSLAKQARGDLATRLGGVLVSEASRFHQAIEAATDSIDTGEALVRSAQALSDAAEELGYA